MREHGERPAGSLIMWHALPLPLEDGNRCGIERVGNLKPRLQVFSSLGVGCDGVYSRPFRRQLRPPLEAPLRVSLGHRLPGAFLSQVFKKPAPYDFGDAGQRPALVFIPPQAAGPAPSTASSSRT